MVSVVVVCICHLFFMAWYGMTGPNINSHTQAYSAAHRLLTPTAGYCPTASYIICYCRSSSKCIYRVVMIVMVVMVMRDE